MDGRKGYRYYMSNKQITQITDCNVLTDSKGFFDQPLNDNAKICKSNIITTGQGDGYKIIRCLLDYVYFILYMLLHMP